MTMDQEKKLIPFTKRKFTSSYTKRFEVWLILKELHHITISFSSSQYDRVLAWAANEQNYMKWM